MAVKVAINGFGRIGRLAFRQMFGAEGYEVVAINDLTNPKMLAHLLKYDSAQGRYDGHTVEAGEDYIVVDGKKITIYAKANAAELPWGEIGVDVVLECTGFYTSKAKAQAHIDAGAKKVVISAPAGNDLPTIVYNVNHKTLKPEDKIISAASCTTNCLAPMAKALNDYAPIQSGIMSTIHAYTGDQMILDGPHRKGDLRRARAGAVNIVPNSTGAAKAIGLVIPELAGKLIGSAQRVPVPSGSITILDATLKDMTDSVSVEGINAAMKAAADESFGYTEEELVSSDIIGMRYGSLFDATQTLAQQCGTHIYEVRIVAWYDNEMSYTCQLIRTLKYLKKGGRITPAAAAIGTVLNLKPVLQLQGEKLDAYSKTRGKKQAKRVMLKAMQNDWENRFAEYVKRGEMCLQSAYTGNQEEAEEFKKEIAEVFPGIEIVQNPLSLSVACHIGHGAIAVACSRKVVVE